jgi:hypothetical protein
MYVLTSISPTTLNTIAIYDGLTETELYGKNKF